MANRKSNKYLYNKKSGKWYEDFAGFKAGKLTIIRRVRSKKYPCGQHPITWLCECECGNKETRHSTDLRKDKNLMCKECYVVFNKHKSRKGPIYGHYMSSIRQSAKKRNLKMSVTNQYLYDLLVEQKFKCAISGISIEFAESVALHYQRKSTASVDRIDSNKGYIKGNIQWVHKRVNIMKQNMTDEELIDWCKKVTRYQARKNKKK